MIVSEKYNLQADYDLVSFFLQTIEMDEIFLFIFTHLRSMNCFYRTHALVVPAEGSLKIGMS